MPVTASRVAVLLNPASGGRRVQAGLRAAALARGLAVHEVGGAVPPGETARSVPADVLVVAGGDGTVSAAAAAAVARDLPLIVVPCGTRNHFAADAGLPLEDPAAVLADALDAGVERRVDVGEINGRIFCNNVSLGFYAGMVRDPQYRSRRLGVTARYVRRAMLGGGEHLEVSISGDPRVVLPEQVLTILVSNNAYSPGLAPGPALRPRLDEGRLWVHVLGVDVGRGPVVGRVVRAAADLVTGRSAVAAWPTAQYELGIDRHRVTVAIDGEAVDLVPPLRLASRPGALRLVVPPAPADRGRVLRVAT